MEIASKVMPAIKTASTLLGVYIGVTTTINVAAAKYDPNGPLWPNKTSVVVSRIAGPAFVQSIPALRDISARPQPGINPFGPINATTAGGIITLIADYIIEELLDGKFGYRYAHPFIQALGMGLSAGGIVGGLLDDPAGPTSSTSSASASTRIGVTPVLRSAPKASFAPGALVGYA